MSLLVCLLAGLSGCTHKYAFVGTYVGKEYMDPRISLDGLSPESKQKVEAEYANSKASLTLNADGTATEWDNYTGNKYIGEWTHNGANIHVSMQVLEVQEMTASDDGKILHYDDWIYTRQEPSLVKH